MDLLQLTKLVFRRWYVALPLLLAANEETFLRVRTRRVDVFDGDRLGARQGEARHRPTETPQEFSKFLREDVESMARLIKQYNLKPE